ncbi:MAG TPA: hypothetical protein VGZ47_20280 [Gemmataceae bacterium]|nr:hypothetical protein [Gemmataceae bacterium]
MAGGWHVRLERDLPGVEISTSSGVTLLYLQRQIDELAERLELRPLSRFFSTNPEAVSAYLAEQGLDPAQYDLPDEEWFEAAEGLEAVRGLLDAIRAEPTSIPKSDRILADLEAIEHVLAAAVLQDVRFHLARNLTSPEEQR